MKNQKTHQKNQQKSQNPRNQHPKSIKQQPHFLTKNKKNTAFDVRRRKNKGENPFKNQNPRTR
jgi:hypothetical protein